MGLAKLVMMVIVARAMVVIMTMIVAVSVVV